MARLCANRRFLCSSNPYAERGWHRRCLGNCRSVPLLRTGCNPHGGTAKTQVYDGTNTVFTSAHPAYIQGTVTSKLQDGSGNAITSTSSALDVNIKSGSGTVQYAEGATAATPTGTVAMGMFGTSVQPLQLDSNSYLKVNVVGGITVTGGSFTAASDGPAGSAVPADASYLGYRDGSGNLVGVGTTTPLPITGSITATDASVGVVVPPSADATQMGFN